MLHLRSFQLRPLCSVHTPSSSSSSPLAPPLQLRFRPSRRQIVQHLKTLGISTSTSTSASPQTLSHVLHIVDYLRSKGFVPSDFPRISFLCPRLFSSPSPASVRDLDLLFAFLASDLSASTEQSRYLVLKCPQILTASVELRLRPTVEYLREIGVSKLNKTSTMNAHLINTPIERLVAKVEFLEGWGMPFEDAAAVCRRCPAIFGYSLEYNLRPKAEYLVSEMERDVGEILRFPQYFAYSLKKKIAPRHRHLKRRNANACVSLPKMLMYGDAKFYAIWQ